MDTAVAGTNATRTYVLIHGAGHGGWCYDRVAAMLRAQGHRVFAPTLPGLAERASENRGKSIDLSAHIEDVAALLEREGIHDAFLCGHSYGGMVITGVAERLPERIHHLVYIDAVVPEHGKRMTDYVFPRWRLYPVIAAVWLLGHGKMLISPPASYFAVNQADRKWVDKRLTRHPFASLREPITLTGKADRIPNHTYIFATKWGFAPIISQYEKAKQRESWQTYEVEAGHDIMIDAPTELTDILLALR